jgi:adenine-specific DNA-methyltransferase
MKGRLEVYAPKYFQEKGILPRTWWDKPEYSARDNGTRALVGLFGADKSFDFPKAPEAVKDCLRISAIGVDGVVLDPFAGSGTTGQATVDLNRDDDSNRRYVLVEMGDHFDTVLKPRMQKVVYSKDWKDGKPVSRDTGVSHMFKYIRLESYEDALANLRLKRTDPQQQLLDKSDAFRESYMLRYMLDVETQGSPSLLDLDQFEDPFSYQILVGAGSVGETKPVNVDLVETFNWLLGLKVKHMDAFDGFRVVEGANPKGEKVLVIWRKIRDLAEQDPKKIEQQRLKANEALDAFFKKQQYNTMDMEFDVVYVNGDNNLMNLPMLPEGEGREPRYKVRLIEEEFKRLMFDVKDV